MIPEAVALRLRACVPEKVAVCLFLAVGICVPYWILQRVEIGIPLAIPATAVDLSIRFAPAWTPVYLSIAALVPLAPWLAPDRNAVLRYARGLAMLCLPSFAIFALLPVTGPRPGLEETSALHDLLVTWDRPTNSLPSLHAGLTVYSLLVIDLFLGRDAGLVGRDAGRAWRAAAWTWGAALLYSTLATKQHWLLDLPPGIVLAIAAWAIAWRGR